MAFPTNILSLASAIGSQFLSVAWGGSVGMAAGLNAILADLIAAETKLGTGASSASANTVLRGTGAGTTAYGQIVSGDITDGTIVNADINAAAAIAYSKLNLAGLITSTDLTNGTLVDADVNASAAIAVSKVAPGANKTLLTSNGTTNSFSTGPTVSGSLTAEAGINAGTTGAGTGEVKTAGAVNAGGTLRASGSVTLGRSHPADGTVVAASATISLGAGFQFVKIINHSTGQMAEFACEGAANTVIQHSSTIAGFTIGDSGANIAIYHDGTVYRVKNRTAGNQSLSIIKDGI